MRLVPVPSHEVDLWAPHICWQMASFAANGIWTAKDFIDQIRSQDRQLWLAVGDRVRAVCLTTVSDDRLKSVCVTHCAGDGMSDWSHFIDGIAAWAREIGAKRLEVTARPGWERVLKEFDLKKTHVVLERAL